MYQANVRQIHRTYGPAIVGRPGTALLIALTFAKGAAYCGYTAIGKQHVLVQRRGRALAPAEQAEALAIIEQVKKTSVPGLFA